MLFITNRIPDQNLKSPMNRKREVRERRWTFDLDQNASAGSVFFCEAGPDGEHTEIGSKTMFARLRDNGARQVLLFVHGFNNPPGLALETAHRLQGLCDALDPGEVEVIALIWPTDNDLGILKDYWDDQRAADASGPDFARVLGKFISWRAEKDGPPCLKRINVLAHSMGSRVLRSALWNWNRYDLQDGVPMLFRNVFLAAADVVNETLETGHSGELIVHSARNVVVYHAADDLALRASKVVNARNRIASRRLGHTGPEDISRTLPNVFSLDCDDFAMTYDRNDGHTYFLEDEKGGPGRVFNHMFYTIRDGRVTAEVQGVRAGILRA